MKYLVRFFVIILITICSISRAENLSIVYVDMEKAMNQSAVGKSLSKQIEKIHKANLKEFKINEEEHKKIQTRLKNNIKERYEPKVVESLFKTIEDSASTITKMIGRLF